MESQRLDYERAVSALTGLCRRRALTPEAVEAVGAAAGSCVSSVKICGKEKVA